MKRKSKATCRNGRKQKKGALYDANHNFDKELRDKEDHINHAMTEHNILYKIQHDGTWKLSSSFRGRDYEIARYDEIFGAGQNAKNERYITNGHRENCKSMIDIYFNERFAPVETILQLSNLEDIENGKFTFEELEKMTHEAAQKLVKDLQQKYGKNIEILDYSLHVDEGVPHVHFRYCFKVQDKDGYDIPNQKKALQEMGFKLTKDEKNHRYSNELIKFSDYLRDEFYKYCELNKDVVIDREVVSQSHRQDEIGRQQLQEVKELVQLRFEKMQQDIEELEHVLNAPERTIDEFKKGILPNTRIIKENELQALLDVYNDKEFLLRLEQNANKNKRIKSLEKENQSMEKEYQNLQNDYDYRAQKGAENLKAKNAELDDLNDKLQNAYRDNQVAKLIECACEEILANPYCTNITLRDVILQANNDYNDMQKKVEQNSMYSTLKDIPFQHYFAKIMQQLQNGSQQKINGIKPMYDPDGLNRSKSHDRTQDEL